MTETPIQVMIHNLKSVKTGVLSLINEKVVAVFIFSPSATPHPTSLTIGHLPRKVKVFREGAEALPYGHNKIYH